jgi:hypothetical protein
MFLMTRGEDLERELARAGLLLKKYMIVCREFADRMGVDADEHDAQCKDCVEASEWLERLGL